MRSDAESEPDSSSGRAAVPPAKPSKTVTATAKKLQSSRKRPAKRRVAKAKRGAKARVVLERA